MNSPANVQAGFIGERPVQSDCRVWFWSQHDEMQTNIPETNAGGVVCVIYITVWCSKWRGLLLSWHHSHDDSHVAGQIPAMVIHASEIIGDQLHYPCGKHIAVYVDIEVQICPRGPISFCGTSTQYSLQISFVYHHGWSLWSYASMELHGYEMTSCLQ